MFGVILYTHPFSEKIREKYLDSHGIFHDFRTVGKTARKIPGIPMFYFKPLFLDGLKDFSCNKPVCSWIWLCTGYHEIVRELNISWSWTILSSLLLEKNICIAIFGYLFTVLSENIRNNQYNHIFI